MIKSIKKMKSGTLLLLVASILVNLSLSNTTIAQDERVRVFIFGTTEDGIIGDGVKKSIELLEKEFNDIEKHGTIATDVIKYIGDNCSLQQLDLLISDLAGKGSDLQDDVLIFYFLGHGYRDANKETPNLLFINTKNGSLLESERIQNSRNLEDIHNSFKNLSNRPRMLLSIGEACNADIAKRNDGKKGDQYVKESLLYRKMLGNDIQPKRYEELFSKTNGDIILYSSLPGSVSYISDTEGGIFTQSFIKGLQQAVTYTSPADWTSIYNITQKYSLRISRAAELEMQIPRGSIQVTANALDEIDLKSPDIGFIERLLNVFRFKANSKLKKARKQWKKIVKGESTPAEFRLFLQTGGEDFLLRAPMNYYWLRGYLDEPHDKKDSYLNYSIAYQLLIEKKDTKDDKIMVNKMDKRIKRGKYSDSKIANEIRAAGNMYQWLKQKQFEQLQYFVSLKDQNTEENNGLIEAAKIIYMSMDSLGQHITQAINEKKDLNQRITNNKIAIESYDRELRNKPSRLKIEVPNARSITNVDRLNLQKYIDCERKGNSNCRAIPPTPTLLQKANISYVPNNSKLPSGLIEYRSEDYKIGKHCDEQINIVTSMVFDGIKDDLMKVPIEYINQLKVDLEITGYADYRGFGKRLGIRFTPSETINDSYINRNNRLVNVLFKTNRTYNITNEQLAFLRAYCAYEKMKRLFYSYTQNQINVNDSKKFKVTFKAIENPTRVESNKFRGVQPVITVKGLFQHIIDKVDSLEIENKNLKLEIDAIDFKIQNWEFQINQLKKKVLEIGDQIDEQKEKISEIDRIIVDNGLYGTNTEYEINEYVLKKKKDNN